MSDEIKLMLDNGPSAAELTQVQTAYDKQLAAMIADDDDLAMLLARLATLGRDIHHLDDLRSRVQRVTLPQLLSAAQRHLRSAPLLSALTHE